MGFEMVEKVLALPVSVEALVLVLADLLALILASPLEAVVHLLILIPDGPGPKG